MKECCQAVVQEDANKEPGNRPLNFSPLQTPTKTIAKEVRHCPQQSGDTKLCNVPRISGILVSAGLNCVMGMLWLSALHTFQTCPNTAGHRDRFLQYLSDQSCPSPALEPLPMEKLKGIRTITPASRKSLAISAIRQCFQPDPRDWSPGQRKD